MIRGNVNRDLEAVVPIEIEDSNGLLQPHSAVLDTGFTGELALPYYLIESLGLADRVQGSESWTLATGEEAQMVQYVGTVLWHGERRQVTILETEGGSLLGASLLSGSRVAIDFWRGGEVVVEEDWPT